MSNEKQKQGEPVAWLDEYGNAFPLAAKQYSVVGKHWKPLYTTPQPAQKPWVGLTNEEIATTADYFKDAYGFTQGVLWAEAKLKEKNCAD
jgi:hypothetical protein